MKRLFFLFFLCHLSCLLNAEVRAIWATSWDIESREKIDALVEDAVANNFNTILPEVRYRGDTLYRPNKHNTEHHNPEKESYILKEDFDALHYLIRKAHKYDIKIIAWITTFVATPHTLKNVAPSHVYFTHPEWITTTSDGKKMSIQATEGAYLDPGIPAVQDYLLNIAMDIIKNYPIDGIQFDYIRYPGSQYGHNPIAKEIYKAEVLNPSEKNWKAWREQQITRFIQRAYAEIKSFDESIEVTAAVISNLDRAIQKYAQNWPTWITQGFLDTAYLMSYTKNDNTFRKQLDNILIHDIKDQLVVGVRAWTDNAHYPATKIVNKIKMAQKKDVKGIACFHYEGMKKNNYFAPIKKTFFNRSKDYVFKPHKDKKFIFGYILNKHEQPVSFAKAELLYENKYVLSDANGFYFFPKLQSREYELQVFFENNVLFRKKYNLKRSRTTSIQQDIKLSTLQEENYPIRCFAHPTENGIEVSWKTKIQTPLSIYRTTIYYEGLRQKIKRELVHIVIDSCSVWEDKYLPSNADFRYQVISRSGKKSNLTYAYHPLNKNIMDILVECDKITNRVQFSFLLETPAHLSWKLMNAKGEDILVKKSWYEKGKTIELWNGISDMGYAVQNGFYTLFCFSETAMESYRKTIYLNRK